MGSRLFEMLSLGAANRGAGLEDDVQNFRRHTAHLGGYVGSACSCCQGEGDWDNYVVLPPSFDRKDHREQALVTKTVLGYENHANVMGKYLAIQGIVAPQKRQELLGDYSTLVSTLLADVAFGHGQPLPYHMDEIIWACENEDKIKAANRSQGPRSGDKNYEVLGEIARVGSYCTAETFVPY